MKKNKKIVLIILIIISIILIGLGIYFASVNKTDKKDDFNKIITVNEATLYLYKNYPLTESNQSYSFIKEDEKYYYFEVINSSDNRQCLVDKINKEVTFEYYFE